MRGSVRSVVRTGFAVVILVVGVAGLSDPASATGGEQGVLRVKGPGSVYAGSGAFVTLYAAAGTTESFGFQVKNTGTVQSQYNVKISGGSCLSCAQPTLAVFAGSLVLTKLTQGPNGYFTAGIDPGKLATYTLRVTLPKTAPPASYAGYSVNLTDTAGNPLDSVSVRANVTKAKGTTDHSQFVSASGTPATTNPDPLFGIAQAGTVTAPSLANGGTATFTIKLMNNSTTVTTIGYGLQFRTDCDNYKTTVKAGATDVTDAVSDGTYSTPPLAHGAATTLTMTVKYLAAGNNLCAPTDTYWLGNTFDQEPFSSRMQMLVNPAATN